jgi:hypothetical protein
MLRLTGVVMEYQRHKNKSLPETDPQFTHEVRRQANAVSDMLVTSYCTVCQKYVAASSDPLLLAAVERIHICDLPRDDCSEQRWRAA